MIHFISPAYKTYPILVPSLLLQSCPGWTLHICHDGPDDNFYKTMEGFGDPRIFAGTSPVKTGDWGHHIRASLLRELEMNDEDYVVVTNHDNYCLPHLVQNLVVNKEDMLIFNCLHSYYKYMELKSKIQFGSIDCASVAVKARIAKKVGWKSNLEASDFLYIQECWQEAESYNFIPKTLFIHN